MAKPQGISLKELTDLSRRNPPRRFLKTILDGLIYDGFRFPTSGSDGCIGGFCISKALPVTLPDVDDKLALHLNFGCTPGNYKPGSLNLKITHFHLTARSETGQLLINDAGPSPLTAGESIHINRNGTWGRPDNCEELADSLNIDTDTLIDQLTGPEGYTTAYMRLAASEMRRAIERTVGTNIGKTKISWLGSDATFG